MADEELVVYDLDIDPTWDEVKEALDETVEQLSLSRTACGMYKAANAHNTDMGERWMAKSKRQDQTISELQDQLAAALADRDNLRDRLSEMVGLKNRIMHERDTQNSLLLMAVESAAAGFAEGTKR